jgi:hypothetical protein
MVEMEHPPTWLMIAIYSFAKFDSKLVHLHLHHHLSGASFPPESGRGRPRSPPTSLRERAMAASPPRPLLPRLLALTLAFTTLASAASKTPAMPPAPRSRVTSTTRGESETLPCSQQIQAFPSVSTCPVSGWTCTSCLIQRNLRVDYCQAVRYCYGCVQMSWFDLVASAILSLLRLANGFTFCVWMRCIQEGLWLSIL